MVKIELKMINQMKIDSLFHNLYMSERLTIHNSIEAIHCLRVQTLLQCLQTFKKKFQRIAMINDKDKFFFR